MDRKLAGITVLALTAIALLVANLAAPTAQADFVVNGTDFQIATARIQQGGEGVYIIDNRTGLMAIFSFDSTTQTMRARDVRPVADALK